MTETRRKDIHRVLLNKAATIQDHANVFTEADRDLYEREILSMLEKDVGLTTSTKVRAAALLWRVGKRRTTQVLLENMNVGEILMVLKLLDADRKIKQLDKKLEHLKKKRKVDPVKQARQRLDVEKIPIAGSSATSSFMKLVKRWVQKIPSDKLEFYLLNFPKEPWKELADYAHLRPDDFTLDYFLPVCFGADAPEGTLCHAMSLCKDDPIALANLLKEYPLLTECYSYLRTQFGEQLTDDAKRVLCATCPLADLIWWYEELMFPGIDEIITTRLAAGEDFVDVTGKNRANFGKIVERLLFFRQRKAPFLQFLQFYADELLKEIKIPTDKKVAVFGDASASMQIAVNTATIVGSVICSCLNGDLLFFNNRIIKPPVIPRNVEDILQVTDAVRANHSTAPSACLYKYLAEKIPVDLFVVVTDEEENTDYNGRWSNHEGQFANTFKLYLEKVNPDAMVFFVSFLNAEDEGYMVEEMAKLGLQEKCLQFRFHPRQPDLTKLTNLLAMLSVETKIEPQTEPAPQPPSPAAATATTQIVNDEDTVTVFCSDGTVQVTLDQEKAIKRAFTNLDTIPCAVLLTTLSKLRPVDENFDDVNSDTWSIVTKSTNM